MVMSIEHRGQPGAGGEIADLPESPASAGTPGAGADDASSVRGGVKPDINLHALNLTGEQDAAARLTGGSGTEAEAEAAIGLKRR